MSLIHFLNTQDPQTLESFIEGCKLDMDYADPFRMVATVTPINQSITCRVKMRLAFYQLARDVPRSCQYCEIRDISSFCIVKTSTDPEEEVIRKINLKLFEKISGFLTQEILSKDPDHKELISLKIKILSQDSALAPFHKTAINIDWIQNQPDLTVSQQLLNKAIIEFSYLKIISAGIFLFIALLVARVVLMQKTKTISSGY